MRNTDAVLTLIACILYVAITELDKQDTTPRHSARWTAEDEEYLLKMHVAL